MPYVHWYAVLEDVSTYFVWVVLWADIKFTEYSAYLEVRGHEFVMNILYIFYYSFVLIVMSFAVCEDWELADPVTWQWTVDFVYVVISFVIDWSVAACVAAPDLWSYHTFVVEICFE